MYQMLCSNIARINDDQKRIYYNLEVDQMALTFTINDIAYNLHMIQRAYNSYIDKKCVNLHIDHKSMQVKR